MNNFFKQIETMGLTTIKEFTGINAENEPHAAFMQMLCDYRFADKEQVMFLTGLSSDGYGKVFKENPKRGARELRINPTSVVTLFFAQDYEESLPHQGEICHLLLVALKDFVEQAKGKEGYQPSSIPMDDVLLLEKLFLPETKESFAEMLNETVLDVWLFIKLCEIEKEKAE